MKGLPDEFRIGPTPVDPALLAAAGDHGGDPAVTLDLVSCLVPVSLTTEGGNEPWGEAGPAPGNDLTRA